MGKNETLNKIKDEKKKRENWSSRDEVNQRIDTGDFSLYDKFLYGGIGYGYICLPKNLLRVIFAILFPPFAIILKHLDPDASFPYIGWENITNLMNNLGDVMYSLILTCLFWVPGVIYAFNSLRVFGAEIKEKKEKFIDNYGVNPDELDENTVKEFMETIRKKKEFNTD